VQVDIQKMENLLNNPWIITIAGGVAVAAFGYYVLGIGKRKEKNKINTSPFISAGGDISTGGDIVIGSKTNSKKTSSKSPYIYKKRTLVVTDPEPKNLSLPIEIPSFKKISSRISLGNADNKEWRVGYRFTNKLDGKRDYVFHVYQNPGSNSFNSRILEIDTEGKEVTPDKRESQIAIDDTKKFTIDIENKNGELFFYVDRIPLGKYVVPLDEISDVYIRGWSHGNIDPIFMTVEYVKVGF
jgi:hypothetical protein